MKVSYVSRTLQPDEEVKFIGRVSSKPIWALFILVEVLMLALYLTQPILAEVLASAWNLVEGALSRVGVTLKEAEKKPFIDAILYLSTTHIPFSYVKVGTFISIIVFLLFGFFPFIFRSLSNEMTVTSMRVVHRRGIIWRETIEIDRGAIESVELSQGIMGRILNYGSVIVRGRGIGEVNLRGIDNPIGLRNAIRALK